MSQAFYECSIFLYWNDTDTTDLLFFFFFFNCNASHLPYIYSLKFEYGVNETSGAISLVSEMASKSPKKPHALSGMFVFKRELKKTDINVLKAKS